MITKTKPNHPLVKAIQAWKKSQAIISLTLDKMIEKARGSKVIAEQKVDGQSALLEYKDGFDPVFASLGGVLYWDLPALTEAAEILKRKGFRSARIVGEMAGFDKGKIIPFNETMSLIHNQSADKTKVHWFPYEILELSGVEFGKSYDTYLKTWPQLKGIFQGAKYIHPVEDYAGGVDVIDKAWKKLVEKDQNEGLVIRLDDNKIYKVKPEYTYDLVIVAVGDKKLLNWPKGLIGSTLMAFMDNNGVFRTAGEVGTGWTQAGRAELFQWAQKNKVGEDDRYVWVKPEKIMEIQYERTTLKDMPAYKFEGGKYVPVGKMPSGTIVKPRFIRWRDDKKVNKEDLRMTQIPNWGKSQKMAMKIAHLFVLQLDGLK